MTFKKATINVVCTTLEYSSELAMNVKTKSKSCFKNMTYLTGCSAHDRTLPRYTRYSTLISMLQFIHRYGHALKLCQSSDIP